MMLCYFNLTTIMVGCKYVFFTVVFSYLIMILRPLFT